MWAEVARSIENGNLYVLAILALGFIGLTFIFERFFMLQYVYNLNFQKFLVNLKKTVAAEDIDRAIAICKKASNTSLPRIALKALETAESDPTAIRGVIEEEAVAFIPRLEKRVAAIAALATLILLLGVLATIDSLWTTFDAIAVMDSAQKQASIGRSVSLSLTYSALGLLFSLIFIAAHQFIRGLAANLADRIQLGVVVLQNLLVPEEMSYLPMGSQEPAPINNLEGAAAGTEAANQVQESANEEEDFDAAAVEDIKDEEEII